MLRWDYQVRSAVAEADEIDGLGLGLHRWILGSCQPQQSKLTSKIRGGFGEQRPRGKANRGPTGDVILLFCCSVWLNANKVAHFVRLHLPSETCWTAPVVGQLTLEGSRLDVEGEPRRHDECVDPATCARNDVLEEGAAIGSWALFCQIVVCQPFVTAQLSSVTA